MVSLLSLWRAAAAAAARQEGAVHSGIPLYWTGSDVTGPRPAREPSGPGCACIDLPYAIKNLMNVGMEGAGWRWTEKGRGGPRMQVRVCACACLFTPSAFAAWDFATRMKEKKMGVSGCRHVVTARGASARACCCGGGVRVAEQWKQGPTLLGRQQGAACRGGGGCCCIVESRCIALGRRGS